MKNLPPYVIGSRQFDFSVRTYLVGVLNVTPDSFSDGGRFLEKSVAVDHAMRMIGEGADIIDVGGESTRPGSESVPLDDELQRVVPVVEAIVARTDVPVSIDTHKSEVAKRALAAGATVVNDVSGLGFDPNMPAVVADSKASLIIMHIKGTPKTMQENPQYGDVVSEIKLFLSERCRIARDYGIDQIIIDPGIGFGKKLNHNLEIFRRLSELTELGYPVMVGPSRKSFIGMILNLPVNERLEGTSAAVAASILNGANLIRVHDVMAMKRVASVVDAIKRGVPVSAPV